MWELALSFYHMGSKEQPEVRELGGKLHYL